MLVAYTGLFSAAFPAATVFAFQWEMRLVGIEATSELSWVLLLSVATAGNALAAVAN